jgi:stearoyl-CoA desaturase (delta-9 desaturase)
VPPVLTAFVVAVVLSQVALLCTTVFLHRALSHRAISLSSPVRGVFRVLVWLMTGIRPRQWVAVHRKHHAFTDVEGDPHSPVLLGFWRVQLTNPVLYRKVARDSEVTKRYAKDLPADRWDRLLFDHALVGLGLGVALLFFAFGWQIALMAAALHTVLYLAINAAVNAVGHTFGRQAYDNSATNNHWLAWLAAGEGWHNNHHAAPTSAKLGLARGQLDPGWWLIQALAHTGQARIRLSELRLVQRAERPLEPVSG